MAQNLPGELSLVFHVPFKTYHRDARQQRTMALMLLSDFTEHTKHRCRALPAEQARDNRLQDTLQFSIQGV